MYENFKYLDAVAQKEITNGVFSGSVPVSYTHLTLPTT